MDNPCYSFYFLIVAPNMVVPMLAFTIRVFGSFSLFSSCYLWGPLAFVASKRFFLKKFIYQNLFVVNYLRLIKLHLFEPCSRHNTTNQFNFGVHIWILTKWCSNRNRRCYLFFSISRRFFGKLLNPWQIRLLSIVPKLKWRWPTMLTQFIYINNPIWLPIPNMILFRAFTLGLVNTIYW